MSIIIWQTLCLNNENTWLIKLAPKQIFKDKDLQLLMFDKKRMKFISPDGRNNDKISISSSLLLLELLTKEVFGKYGTTM